MTRSEIALRRRRLNRKIRETVALRRFTATVPIPSTPTTPTPGPTNEPRDPPSI